jgi:uncharacterized circularly permuted ATP-grasp superfamily protein
MLIEPGEWQAIEAGVSQRARLLNEILVDLYGEQRSLKSGTLPPGMVFGSSQFLRPCANISVRKNQHLQFIAFDMARGPDGRWWVLSDRTGPSRPGRSRGG